MENIFKRETILSEIYEEICADIDATAWNVNLILDIKINVASVNIEKQCVPT